LERRFNRKKNCKINQIIACLVIHRSHYKASIIEQENEKICDDKSRDKNTARRNVHLLSNESSVVYSPRREREVTFGILFRRHGK
jgi:hypothetical protein